MIATAKTLNKTAQKILFALAGSYVGAKLSVVTLARTYAHESIVVARYTKHTRHKNNIIICGIGSVFRIAMILSILVDTFISKISLTMQPGPKIDSISGA